MAAALFFWASASHGESVTLGWEGPGSDPIFAGYKLYYGTQSRDAAPYPNVVDIPASPPYTLEGLVGDRTYFFAVTAYDVCGNETDFSAELAHFVPKIDSDGDGITNDDEENVYQTDPHNADTDGDGIDDGDELQFWGELWSGDMDGDGLPNLLDPDADNDGQTDGAELGDFDPTDPAFTCAPAMEIGKAQADGTWRAVNFTANFTDPVVMTNLINLNDGADTVVRIRNVTAAGFEISLQDWGSTGGALPEQTVSYFAVERGRYMLANGTQLIVDSFSTRRSDSFGTVSFDLPFQTAPIVMTTIASTQNPTCLNRKIQNITTGGFEYALHVPESAAPLALDETLAYLAWEPSTGQAGGLSYEIGKIENSLRHGFGATYFFKDDTLIMRFIADLQTTEGAGAGFLRWEKAGSGGMLIFAQ